MAGSCCKPASSGSREVSPGFRRALWIALLVNAAMFAVEIGAGWQARSISLQADALDFFGDAVNYGISLWALGIAVVWRSRSALLKGVTMGGYGLFILGHAAWAALHGVVPDARTMGIIGLIALIANVSVAAMLYVWREGDANMRSVWLCSRNDAIGNLAVMLAAAGVFGSQSAWPDLLVAVLMGGLGLMAARTVIVRALTELRSAHPSRTAKTPENPAVNTLSFPPDQGKKSLLR